MNAPLPTAVTMKTVYHADLGDAHQGEDYWLQACGKRYPLIPHTADTLAAARAASPLLAALPAGRITHYTEDAADLPTGRVVRVHLKHTLRNQPSAKAAAGIGHVAMHVPPAQGASGAHATAATAFHAAIDYVSTAKALVFHHADLINADPTVTAAIYDHMDNNRAISDQFNVLALQMRQMGPPTETSGWANLVPFTPPASELQGCDGKTAYYQTQATKAITAAAGDVMTAMMIATKNDPALKGKKWTLQQGTAVRTVAPQVVARLQAGADDWQAALGVTETAHGLSSDITVLDAGARQIQLTMTNTYIRYLGAYIRFLDAAGNPIDTPSWTPDDTDTVYDAICGMDLQYDNMRFLGLIEPIDNFMAIPIYSAPGQLQVKITFPEAAVSAELYAASLGTGSDDWPKTPVVGGLLTGLLNLGIPAFMLAASAAIQSYKPLYDMVQKLAANKAFIALLVTMGGAYLIGGSVEKKKMDWYAFTSLAQLLFDPLATKLLVYCETEMAGELAVDEIPFAGWIVLAVDIATGLAQMAETIAEVASSPWNIANSIATSITTTVNVHPDPRHQAFPEPGAGQSASLVVKMIYQGQVRPTIMVTVPVPANSTATTLSAAFPGNTLGGQVKFEADYYIGTWLAGKATSGIMNNDEADVADLEMYIVQYPVPLSSASVYAHASMLVYQGGAYQWQQGAAAPTATLEATNTQSTGNAISVWSGLTLSQRHGMIGMAWKAAGTGISACGSSVNDQVFVMENIDIPGMPMAAVEFPTCGFEDQTMLAYDPYPPKFLMKDGNWQIGPDGKPLADPSDRPLGDYYVDPRKANNDAQVDGGFHLRKISLAPPAPFNMSGDQLSFGIFPFQPDSLALHPSGSVIAINTQSSKIQILSLETDGASDATANVARVYAGQAQVPDRPGLLFHPVAVSCAYDGTVLVLEDTKSSATQSPVVLARVQAFDLVGNPVNRFVDAAGAPSAFLELSTTGENTYLDIAAVGDQTMIYMYVLYYTGDGALASDYHVSIYQYSTGKVLPNPLVTTDNVAAARLAVDMWHTMYVLNYAMVTDGSGNPAGPVSANAGPGGRTVPSVSAWLPPTPAP